MDELNFFFSYWFIHKALWASIEGIKSNISSWKDYKYMCKLEYADLKKHEDMLVEIKEKNNWIENYIEYEDDIEL